jgi:hypothetical protein
MHDGAVAAGTSTSPARDTLFDKTAAEAGIYQSALRPFNGLAQPLVFKVPLAGKSAEHLGGKNPHSCPGGLYNI